MSTPTHSIPADSGGLCRSAPLELADAAIVAMEERHNSTLADLEMSGHFDRPGSSESRNSVESPEREPVAALQDPDFPPATSVSSSGSSAGAVAEVLHLPP